MILVHNQACLKQLVSFIRHTYYMALNCILNIVRPSLSVRNENMQ